MAESRAPEQLVCLLVQQDLALRSLLRNGLKNSGIETLREASGPVEGMQALREGEVDVVLADQDMHPVSGTDFAAQVRNEGGAAGKRLPFILLVPDSSSETLQEAQDNGADLCLPKPVSPDSMFQAISQVLNEKAGVSVESPSRLPAAARRSLEKHGKKQDGSEQPQKKEPVNTQAFQRARVLVGEPDEKLRTEIQRALLKVGFKFVEVTGSASHIAESIRRNEVDVLVSETALHDGDVCNLSYRMRHHELGDNPFPIVIAIMNDTSRRAVTQAIDSGVDDVLLKPLDKHQLVRRVARLTRGRKAFVVTSDYIGPDRRKRDRPGSQRIPTVPVPNPLRPEAADDMPGRTMQDEIDRVSRIINEQKMERHAFQIWYLVDRVIHQEDKGLDDETIQADLERLVYVAEDISRRLTGSRYAHASQLCLSMVNLAADVRDCFPEPMMRDLELMAKLAQAILGAFRLAEGTPETATEIVRSLRDHKPAHAVEDPTDDSPTIEDKIAESQARQEEEDAAREGSG